MTGKRKMGRQYNNKLTPEALATIDQSPFTAEQRAEMDEGSRALPVEQKAFCREHPITALYHGDEIISPPQVGAALTGREVVAMPPDFLTATGDA
jgi:hypothetical protein